MDRLRRGIDADGYGLAAARDVAATARCIGFVGIQVADLEPAIPTEAIEIGWRLAPEYWGKGYVTEAARAWLAFGFETLGLRRNRLLRGARQSPLDRRDAAYSACAPIRAATSTCPTCPTASRSCRPHVLYRSRRRTGRLGKAGHRRPVLSASVRRRDRINPSGA